MGTEFLDELGETLSRTARGISEKAETIYETQRIRNRIVSEKRAEEKVLAQIGEILYKRYKEGEESDGELTELFEMVDGHRDAVCRYKKELADRKGKKICPSCQKEVDREVAYCPYCGSACPSEEPQKEEPGEEIPKEEEAPAPENGEEASVPGNGEEAPAPENEEKEHEPETPAEKSGE